VKRLEHLLEKQNQQIEELRSILKERGSNGNSSGVLQERERGACLLPPAPGPCTTLSLQRQGKQAQKIPCHAENNARERFHMIFLNPRTIFLGSP
jgi:hypothetical protein